MIDAQPITPGSAAAPGPTGIEGRLLDERHRVIEEIFSQASNGNGSRPGLQDHDYDQLGQLRDLECCRRESLDSRLRQLDVALERLRGGVYGKCVECGSPIAGKRLEADAAVSRCIDCQESSEPAVSHFTL